jgi:hypothetical protein
VGCARVLFWNSPQHVPHGARAHWSTGVTDLQAWPYATQGERGLTATFKYVKRGKKSGLEASTVGRLRPTRGL